VEIVIQSPTVTEFSDQDFRQPPNDWPGVIGGATAPECASPKRFYRRKHQKRILDQPLEIKLI
jgi:hypothetical protein